MAGDSYPVARFDHVTKTGLLVFAVDGASFAVDVDETLERALLEAKQLKAEHHGEETPAQQRTLPISQIQTLIRAGMEPDQVAERYGLSPILVRRFSSAVESEKSYAIEQFLRGNETLAVLGSALVGLIPNCSASVVITQLYLEGALQLAPMLAGTLISAGVGYLVLFRTNRSARENAVFLVMMYVIGAGWGLILSAFGL